MNLLSFIFPQTLAKYNSFFNGEILVKEVFGKKYIEVGGLMQSGRILNKLFQKGLTPIIQDKNIQVKRVLVLGVGGGTLLHILNNFFPKAKIVAYDIDPVIVAAGKKYFAIGEVKNLNIHIADVFSLKTNFGNNYDLIIVDLFKGYAIPKELNSPKFLNKLRQAMHKNGYVIFNRLYFQKYKNEADQFLDKLTPIFHSINWKKIYFNILIYAKY